MFARARANAPRGTPHTAARDIGGLGGPAAGLMFTTAIAGASRLAKDPFPAPGTSPEVARTYYRGSARAVRFNVACQALSALAHARYVVAMARLASQHPTHPVVLTRVRGGRRRRHRRGACCFGHRSSRADRAEAPDRREDSVNDTTCVRPWRPGRRRSQRHPHRCYSGRRARQRTARPDRRGRRPTLHRSEPDHSRLLPVGARWMANPDRPAQRLSPQRRDRCPARHPRSPHPIAAAVNPGLMEELRREQSRQAGGTRQRLCRSGGI